MSQDFCHFFIWAPDNQAKLVLLKHLFLEDIREISDSVQCKPARSRTPRSVSLRRVQLRAVLACPESDSTQCLPILDLLTFQFLTLRSVTVACAESNSAQANTGQSH